MAFNLSFTSRPAVQDVQQLHLQTHDRDLCCCVLHLSSLQEQTYTFEQRPTTNLPIAAIMKFDFSQLTFGSITSDELHFIKLTSSMDTSKKPVTMPSDMSSYNAETTPNDDDMKTNDDAGMVYIVFQHSRAAGQSALLPFSNVLGVFDDYGRARGLLHKLKAERKPLVRTQAVDRSAGLQFWNTGGAGEEDLDGYQYVSEHGEEYVVWIEEHELQK